MKVYIKYDKDGLPIGMGESIPELAKDVGTYPQTIRRAIKRNSDKYAVVEIDEMEEVEDE